ncbi:MAG: hypothetical protein ABI821_12340 [Pseudomonadota bacterium]
MNPRLAQLVDYIHQPESELEQEIEKRGAALAFSVKGGCQHLANRNSRAAQRRARGAPR